MRKSKTLIAVIVVLGILAFYLGSQYNRMVVLDEEVKASWGQVENVYQRRADLIPNLVNTVKGYANHEKSTLESVIQARASATQVKVDPENLTAKDMEEFMAKQSELSSALSRLLVSVEAYPDLKANENFKMLQVQLEGTENRITVERARFNDVVKNYNQYIRKFPKNLVASIFGFGVKPLFEAKEGADVAPEVQF
ncbi:LemA family protein [Porphyromonas canoris]|uniref:LemA family protein n=1 Tax=Porphyromonas canoris TaxID=36875 RepID=A0ABR4XKQ0_9PORP|nr:LemA family protein [Porphyromonas canoris]KGN92261.1 LemA family protein [Porphyromonas canoris]